MGGRKPRDGQQEGTTVWAGDIEDQESFTGYSTTLAMYA